ncbi:FAD-dependent oxidoreductase [Methylobacter sp.]|uniref:FAD-dependent oxidoreductase n=1 Tax=Methylobacter sp. TaxID=2051955 RepID=UPI002FDD4F99
MDKTPTIIVFSHLRWNWVWQRPQHLLSRLAKRFRVMFIEEPVLCETWQAAHWRFERSVSSVLVCTPYTTIPDPGFNGNQLHQLSILLDQLVDREALQDLLVWLYMPMALPLARRLKPLAMVYDVMDELSASKYAPPEFLEWEAEAYRCVDLVFTGGPSLYRAKRDRHPNVHYFPNSVDAAHFGKARDTALDHVEQASRPRPRFGFFGVIDERIDLPLLDQMALERPEWQLMMVGPVTRIDPGQLPQHPNIHYWGQQSYDQLPAFLAGWDVCLLPFACNESTRFISPAKTLEYMAAEKPIVSTPIADVAEPYGDIVYLGDTADAFLSACDLALNQSAEQFNQRLTGIRKILLNTSWDMTARAMVEEIGKIQKGRVRGAPAKARARKDRTKVAIIGAGPTGLSAAFHAQDSVLLEANNTVGGWCSSLEENGFTFDFAGHIIFSKEPYVHEMYRKLLGDNVHWQDRGVSVYSNDLHTRYPLKGGFQSLMNGFLPYLKTRLRLNSKVVSISPGRHNVTLADGSTLEYGHLISTMPLPILFQSLRGDVPVRIRQASEALRHVSVRSVNLGIGRPNLTEKYWIYYPEDTVFHRIFVQGNANPHCNPPGGFGLTCEITYAPGKPLPCDGDALIQQCIRDCHKVGIFSPEDPVWAANQVDMPYAYVIYDHARAANLKLVRDWLAERDIILAGRYSEWEYYNADHAFLVGKQAVESVRGLQAKRIAVPARRVINSGVIATGISEGPGQY